MIVHPQPGSNRDFEEHFQSFKYKNQREKILIIQDVLGYNLFLTKIDISTENGKREEGGGIY